MSMDSLFKNISEELPWIHQWLFPCLYPWMYATAYPWMWFIHGKIHGYMDLQIIFLSLNHIKNVRNHVAHQSPRCRPSAENSHPHWLIAAMDTSMAITGHQSKAIQDRRIHGYIDASMDVFMSISIDISINTRKGSKVRSHDISEGLG